MSSTKKNTVFKIIAVCLITVSVGIGVFLMLRGSESYTSVPGSEDVVGALVCRSQTQTNEILHIKDEVSFESEIKITYRNESLDKIAYNYNGVFQDARRAEAAASSAHANYNIYMGNNGLSIDSLSPAFLASGKNLRIDFYSTISKLSNAEASLFFLTDEEIRDVQNLTTQRIQSFYESKGFTCKTTNN